MNWIERLLQEQSQILLVFLAGLAIVLVGGAYTVGSRLGKTSVSLVVVGKNAKVLVNDKIVRGNPLYLKPGSYKISAQAEGFQPVSKTVEVGKHKTAVTLILSPESEAAKVWAKAHEGEYLKAEAVAGEQSRKEGEDFYASNPLAQTLPYKTDYYSLDYRVDEKGSAIIQITASGPLGRKVAIEKIRSSGFDPTDYVIEFTGLTNPFASDTGGAR